MEKRSTIISSFTWLMPALLAVALIAFLPAGADAYTRYAGNPGCDDCHGNFTDSTSTKGSVFIGGEKHEMHRSGSGMNTDCSSCHVSTGDNPEIGNSAGGGPSCTGCHEASGLRRHHAVNGVGTCAGCHSGDPVPPAENVNPAYYGTAVTNVDNACNPTATQALNENWTTNDFVGTDNDGDNLYDRRDPDCITTAPAADAKVNGLDNLTAPFGTPIVIDVSLACNDVAGLTLDTWIVVKTTLPAPLNWVHYDLATGAWLPGLAVSGQNVCADMVQQTIYAKKLPVGTYQVFLGVDTLVDGSPTFQAVFMDKARIVVTN